MKHLPAALLSLLAGAITLSAQGRRVPVIPVEFSDCRFSDTQSGIAAKISTAEDYFNSQLPGYGPFEFMVLPTVKLRYQMSYYGANSTSVKDLHIDEAVRTACSSSGVDFSVYDSDGDGFVDNLCLVTAGASESAGGGVTSIWPAQAKLSERGSNPLTIGNVRIDSFSVCPEASPPSVFCHEYAHSLGLQDMYDTDGYLSGGLFKGLWGLSVMDNADVLPCLNAIELEQLGAGTALTVQEGHYTLRPVSSRKEYLRLETDNPGEYFLLECRDNESWDSCLKGSGLIIYHVDRSLGTSWYSDLYKRNLTAVERWELNQVNCRPEHPCARVIEATGGTAQGDMVFFPQPGHDCFASETDPTFRYWSDATSPLAICNIAREQDGSVGFDLVTPIGELQCIPFQDAALISWEVSEAIDVQSCTLLVQSKANPSLRFSNDIPARASGVYSCTVGGLKPQDEYVATVRVLGEGGANFSATLEFSTKMMRDTRPFIYLNSLVRNPDGSFAPGGRLPLMLYNAAEVIAVSWTFDGKDIQPGDDGLWEIPGSGTLRAELEMQDGSREIISKTLIVK